MLRKDRLVIFLAVTSLTLAIAGNTVVFSLVNGMLFRPLPYENPHEIYFLSEYLEKEPSDDILPTSEGNFADWHQRQDSFESLAAFRPGSLPWTPERGETQPLEAAFVSPGFFQLLGTSFESGRGFLEREAVEGNDHVVVVTRKFLSEQVGSSGNALNRTLTLREQPYQIVGILPADFEFLDPSIQVYLPLALDPANLDRGRRDVFAVGRLPDGASPERAEAELRTLMAQLRREHPNANQGYAVHTLNLRHEVPERQDRQLLYLLQGALLFVLLIACANVGNLFLARSLTRERELAVRMSFGAPRRRVQGQLLIENLAVAVLAGLLSLPLTWAGMQVMRNALTGQLPTAYIPVLDGRVLAFGLLVTLVAGLLFGAIPAFHATQIRLRDALQQGGRAASASRRHRRLSQSLVVAEIALSLVLLGGANGMIRSFQEMRSAEAGFSTDGLVTAQVHFSEASRDSGDQARQNQAGTLLRRLGALPGVSRVALADSMPQAPSLPSQAYAPGTRPPDPNQSPPRVDRMAVSPTFFETLGIEMQQGRALHRGDRGEAAQVCVINRDLAERHWAGRVPVGQYIHLGGDALRIVGVAETVRHTLSLTDSAPVVYVPWAGNPSGEVYVALRPATSPEQILEPMRREIRQLAPELTLSRLQTFDEYLQQFFVGGAILVSILGGFGLLALLLAALGTYGILSHSVAQQRHELGVRMAIGANRGSVFRRILLQAGKIAGLGLALGIPGSFAVTWLISKSLAGTVEVHATAPLEVAFLLLLVALLAAALPAYRASRLNPAETLRQE